MYGHPCMNTWLSWEKNKTIVCFIQGCFSIDWVIGSLLGKELIHSWVCQLWIPNYEKANPKEQKAFLDSSDLKKIRIFRTKPCWIAEHLTRKHWRSSAQHSMSLLHVLRLITSCQSLPAPRELLRTKWHAPGSQLLPAPVLVLQVLLLNWSHPSSFCLKSLGC